MVKVVHNCADGTVCLDVWASSTDVLDKVASTPGFMMVTRPAIYGTQVPVGPQYDTVTQVAAIFYTFSR